GKSEVAAKDVTETKARAQTVRRRAGVEVILTRIESLVRRFQFARANGRVVLGPPEVEGTLEWNRIDPRERGRYDLGRNGKQGRGGIDGQQCGAENVRHLRRGAYQQRLQQERVHACEGEIGHLVQLQIGAHNRNGRIAEPGRHLEPQKDPSITI